MDASPIATIRKFNRVVTQRLGVLSDHYLARGRSLGASRVLWEIGLGGADVRLLRARLELDSGYLSRLLRALEREGLVTVASSPADRRVRTARLTRRGIAEWQTLDRKSDEIAASLLAQLNERQRAALVEALAVAERLLSAGLVEVRLQDPTTDEAQACIASYFAELQGRLDGGFDPANGFGTNGWSDYSMMSAFLFEVIATAIFIMVILGATQDGVTTGNEGLIIGLTLVAQIAQKAGWDYENQAIFGGRLARLCFDAADPEEDPLI